MKTTLTIVIIFTWAYSFGQFERVKGRWITPEQDYICIQDSKDNGNILNNKMSEWAPVYLSIQNNTLRFVKRGSDGKGIFENPYFLKLLYINDSIMIVKPITDYSMKFFQNRESIKFTRQEYTVDTTIKFEKIIYHTTDECLGNCPEINLQINNKKQIYFDCVFRKNNFSIDMKRTGHFYGVLNNLLYTELVHLIQTCNLRTLKFEDVCVDDAPEKTFIIYYNGQRKYLKSRLPPFIIDSLRHYLENINLRTQLMRTDIKLYLEE